jgi:invasion protein IalB
MTVARTLCFALAAIVVPLLAGHALAQGNETAAEPTNTFSDWVLETSGEGANKVCFIATTAKQLGAGPAKRSVSVLYISAWPKDGIKSEISIKLGFTAKAAAGAKVSIGKEAFKLFINDERAFVADATQELKLVEAMKKGAKLMVEATAQGGGQVIDTYSLSGLGQALQAQAAACP